MCGIAGVMTRAPEGPDAARLDRMAAALAHRGPDGRGDYRSGRVGMVQTRLAVIDLETGDQPLYGPSGAGLIANGEIYNYRELRAAMPDSAFRTRSDCEPPVHLYARDGSAFTAALRGMYAIAVHDTERDRLLLTRDPFGIKPLYYTETPEGVAFASEIQALHTERRPQRLAEDRLAELLQLQFTTGASTVFPDVRRLLPGETIVIEGGCVTDREHAEALPAARDNPEIGNDEAALMKLDSVLEDSVEMHQRADVPYGMFLSGGVDSSAVLAMMARLNPRPVLAFTAGFPGTAGHDEREHGRRVANAVGAEHVEVPFTEEDFWQLLPAVAACMDDPTADYATLPTFKLAQEAARHVKVVLSGEGGDEIFAGYGRYRRALRPRWLGGRTMRLRGAFDGLKVLREPPRDWRDGIAAAERAAQARGLTGLTAAQTVDCATYLPNDLLIKLDRCLMAHGVEGRTPFLDREVAAFAFALPDRLKVRKGHGKWLLRRWLDRVLPEADAFSRKRGFTVPVQEWIAAKGTDLGPRVARYPAVAEIAEPDAVVDLFRRGERRTGFAAWTLLFYALWHRHHVAGAPIAGDVFEALPVGG